jgi:RNA polymerase sporulation-specific sigma factor
MSIIVCGGVSLSYGADEILNNVTFSVNEGDKVGIIGVNGAGKSTLFSIIRGQLETTSGDVFISSGAKIGCLEQINDAHRFNSSIYESAVIAFEDLIKLENEIASLRNRMENGDESAKQRLIERNLRLVVFIARGFENTGINLEDLISIGTIGLIKAIGTYRRDKNIKLATYASRCIENEILMYIRKIAGQKAEVSLDEPINMDYDGNELLLSDILGTEEDMILKPLEDDVDLCVLRQSLRGLPDREREIVLMRFGLEGRKEQTQKEVAQLMGISQSYISRLEKRIMLRLRKEFLKQTNCA